MRSMRLSKKHNSNHVPIQTNINLMMMTTIIPMTNPMVPNISTSLKSSLFSPDNDVIQKTSSQPSLSSTQAGQGCSSTTPMLHPEDSNLYCIPSDLSSIYKHLPVVLRMIIGIMSTYLLASRSFIIRSTIDLLKASSTIGVRWWLPIRFIRTLLSNSAWAKKHVFFDLLKISIKSFILYTFTVTAVQDLMPNYQPSRISIADLLSRYNNVTLPSRYSNYHQLTNFIFNPQQQQQHPNVHYLKAIGDDIKKNSKPCNLDAIYLNHGFGASSLSWLPTIPALLQHLNTKILLGHDAPGFGFTDRLLSHTNSVDHENNNPLQSSYYSIHNSATIGTTILQKYLTTTATTNVHATPNKCILLLGHSLGSLTTLRMALQGNDNDATLQQHIILVSPAIGLQKSTSPPKQQQSKVARNDRRRYIPTSIQRPLQRIGTSIACYGLKRFVGQRNFWRNGLQKAVWNDGNGKNQLRDCDVVRYQWPAIVKDWEYGLVQFASEQVTSSTTTNSGQQDEHITDIELVQAVLSLPHVASLHVIVGSKDRVIPNQFTVNFFRDNFPAVNITVMEGCGHNPFEEDPELFVEMVQSILLNAERKSNIG